MTKTQEKKKRLNTLTLPATYIDESEKEEYLVYVAMPGMDRKDFTVNIQDNELVVCMNRKEGQHSFMQAASNEKDKCEEKFTLPVDADAMMASAVYQNGELVIHIPRGSGEGSAANMEVFVY